MRFGLPLSAVSRKHWGTVAQEAERLGFESLWMPEHLVLPVAMTGSPQTGHSEPPITADVPAYDVFVALASVGARTSTIRLGTNVYNIGLRHPFVTARSVTTLDMLVGGRFEFGVGASWLEEEWDAVQLDFRTRGRRVDEALEVCSRLWSADEDVIAHEGVFWRFPPVKFNPKPPQQPGPPILVGGDGRAAKRRAVRFGSGWIPMNTPAEALPAAIADLERMREEAGREDRIAITVDGRVGDLEDLDLLRRLEEMGVDRVICRPWRSSRDALDGMRRYTDEVLRKL